MNTKALKALYADIENKAVAYCEAYNSQPRADKKALKEKKEVFQWSLMQSAMRFPRRVLSSIKATLPWLDGSVFDGCIDLFLSGDDIGMESYRSAISGRQKDCLLSLVRVCATVGIEISFRAKAITFNLFP